MLAYVYVPRNPLVTNRYYVLLAHQSAPKAPVYFGQGEEVSEAAIAAERTQYESQAFWPLPPSGKQVAAHFRLDEEVVLLDDKPLSVPDDVIRRYNRG